MMELGLDPRHPFPPRAITALYDKKVRNIKSMDTSA